MTRSVVIADAACATFLARSSPGMASVERSPISAHVNIMSMSVNPASD
jgi:hypothetical protein